MGCSLAPMDCVPIEMMKDSCEFTTSMTNVGMAAMMTPLGKPKTC
jgi:hypothetical protein